MYVFARSDGRKRKRALQFGKLGQDKISSSATLFGMKARAASCFLIGETKHRQRRGGAIKIASSSTLKNQGEEAEKFFLSPLLLLFQHLFSQLQWIERAGKGREESGCALSASLLHMPTHGRRLQLHQTELHPFPPKPASPQALSDVPRHHHSLISPDC